MQQLIDALAAGGVDRDDVTVANLERDLSAVLRRLHAGEYARTDFVERNVFDVPRRTREFFSYMEGYLRLAGRWIEALDGFPISELDDVVDLCPGWAPKIELALLRTGFRGTVVVVDTDARALAALSSLIAGFAPPFTMAAECADFFAPPARRFRCAVANHVVDDLILSRFAPEPSSSLYEDEGALVAAWLKIAERADEVVAGFPAELAEAFSRWVAPDGWLLLSHYDSFVDELLGSPVRALVDQVFRATVSALVERGFVVEREAPAGYVRLKLKQR